MSRWPDVNLRRVATLGTGHTPSRQRAEYWANCTIPWLTLADVWQLRDGTRTTVDQTAEKISELGVANSSAVVHGRGTVAMSRTASVGFSCILGQDMATSQDFVTWSCGPLLDPRFLLHSIRGQRDRILGMRMGSTHQTIYMPDVERISTPLPPPETQRAIADFLDAETARIDALIAKKHRLIEVLAERLAGVIETTIRHLAAKYGEQPLRYAAPEILVGIVVTPAAYYSDEGVLALRGVNVKAGRFELREVVNLSREGHLLHQKSVLHEGDLVVVRTGQAGAACVVTSELEGVNCIDLLIVRSSSALVSKFLEYVLNSDWTIKHIEANSVGTIQAHFNVEALKALPLPVPPLDVQMTVTGHMVAARANHEAAVALLQRQIDLLVEHRQALITAAVTGELEVAA